MTACMLKLLMMLKTMGLDTKPWNPEYTQYPK